MDKSTIKAFMAWLESETEGAVLQRRAECLKALEVTSTPEVRANINLALRLIDEELQSRRDLFRTRQRHEAFHAVLTVASAK